MRRSGEDGYILASALAALFSMSLVAAALVSVSGSALGRVKRMEIAAQDRYAIESAIRLVASQLAVDPRRRELSIDDGAVSIPVGVRPVRLDISWETLRLDANRAPPEDIDAVLIAAGLNDTDRSEIMAEVRAAQSVGVPVEMLDQLDLSPRLLACASEQLTVFGGQVAFDPDATLARAVTGRPAAGARIRIDARTQGERSAAGRTAILLMTGDGRDPYRVLDWRGLRGNPKEACDEE